MASSGGGGRPATLPRSVPACPPELKSFFRCLVTLLRQMEVGQTALAFERTRLLAEIEFLQRERRYRELISQDCIEELRRGISVRDETAKLLEHKRPEARDPALDEFGDNYLESVRRLLLDLTDENTKLKEKLKEVGSQAELSESTVDHQHSAKDSRADVRKLKKAYKTMVSEKDKQINAIRAENSFLWNQFKTLEKDLKDACKSKCIEIERASEAAEEREKFRLEAQEKDGEIGRLQVELVSTKEKHLMVKNELEKLRLEVKEKDVENGRLQVDVVSMKEKYLMVENELEKLRLEVQEKDVEIGRLQAVVSMKENKLMVQNELEKRCSFVKSKDGETDQPETSQKWKKDLKETNRKSNLGRPVSSENSRIPHVTPVRSQVKTSRKRVSNAKGAQNQSGNNSRMHNKEERGQPETSQKRKRVSGSLSHSVWRRSPRAAESPMLLFSPSFTIPKLSGQTPPQL